jgi:RNA polymerase sigma-70 factor (ECF subfamily)
MDPEDRDPSPVSLAHAWPTLFRENERWIRLVVRSRLRESQAIDEVMQNIALELTRSQAPLRELTRVSAWLYRIAVRQCLMYRRGAGRARRLLARVARHHRPDTETSGLDGDPLGWLVRRERGDMIREALDRLPPRDGEILLLKYVEDWSTRQISDRLGVSRSAIEARLHRARRRLRSDLVRNQVVEPCE